MWELYSAFTGGARPRVNSHVLFQASVGTRVKPPIFRKPAGQLPQLTNMNRYSILNIREHKTRFNLPVEPCKHCV